MRHIFLILLLSCSAARADDVPEECGAFEVTSMPVLELKPVEVSGVISIDEMPASPKRLIEVYAGRRMEDGVLLPSTCSVEGEDRSVDYNDCCPLGWQPLAWARRASSARRSEPFGVPP
jgi:hypothetical protein